MANKININIKEYANEYQLHKAVVEWLTFQYPDVLFHSDLSGVKLPIGLAMKMKCLNPTKGYPDLFIIEPYDNKSGLYIEIKLLGTKIHKKDGTFSTPHIEEQWNYLEKLRNRHFVAEFGIGFDNIIYIIRKYFKAI